MHCDASVLAETTTNRISHQAGCLKNDFYNVFRTNAELIVFGLYVFLTLQGDGGPGGKSKIRAKKPSSKYNEEISSDSETERSVSDAVLLDRCGREF